MLIYDGNCGFCTRTARWISRRLPVGIPVVASQDVADLGVFGLTERDVMTASYWVGPEGRTHRGHGSVARSLIAAGGWWSIVGRVVLVPPISLLAAVGYWLVARNRHRLPGGTEACRIDVDHP